MDEVSSQQGELSVICGCSTQQLFPPKQVIVKSGPSINSDQSSLGNVSPNFLLQIFGESFVSLPGGNASIGKNIFSASTLKSPSQNPVSEVCKDLENSIGNKKDIFLNRFIEGYYGPRYSLFVTWKALYTDWE